MACSVCLGSQSSSSTAASASLASASFSAKKSSANGLKCTPCPFVPSCETQYALASCFKKMFCDVLRCLGDAVKQDLQEQDDDRSNPLTNCLKTAIISFAECVPDALCGPKTSSPEVRDSLPCDFAVEETFSVNAPKSLVLAGK